MAQERALTISIQLNCHPGFVLDAGAEVASEIDRVLLVRAEAVFQPERVDLVDLQLLGEVEPPLLVRVVPRQPETRHVEGIVPMVVLE